MGDTPQTNVAISWDDVIGLASIGTRLYDRVCPEEPIEEGSLAARELSIWRRLFAPLWANMSDAERSEIRLAMGDFREEFDEAVADLERHAAAKAIGT